MSKNRTSKTVVPNVGKPEVGANVAWVKGLKKQTLIRVHLQSTKNMTLCRALNTKDSPYIGTGGHIAFKTTAKLTCKPCLALAPKVAKKVKKTTTPKTQVEAPVEPTPAPVQEAPAA